MSDVVLPDEVLRALESGGWVADESRFRRGSWFVSIEASPSVFGSWKWVVEMTDRNEVRTSYGVTKLLCDFLRFGA